MTTTINEAYTRAAWAGALDDFDQAAGPGNINDPLFKLACDLLELAHAAPDLYSEADAEREACNRARMLGHDEASITGTWRSAEKTTRGKARHIPAPTYTNGRSPAGFADLAAYAASRGVPVEAYERAGWSDALIYEFAYTDKAGKPQTGHDDQERLVYTRARRALRFETNAGPRYRLIDEDRPAPKYWHRHGTHTDANKAWYGLGGALALAAQVGYLALVNGEASVVAAQHHGVPALCETGGGEKLTPPQLLQFLRAVYPDGPIVIALDCDKKGQTAALKKAEQYRDAGYGDVRAIDLGLGAGGEDVADFCRLHGQGAASALRACADLAGSSPSAPATPGTLTQSEAIIRQLDRLGYTFRLNLCTDMVECNGQPLTDLKAQEIRTALRNEGRKQFGAVDDAIGDHAARTGYHPIKDYLDALTWDGMGWIAHLAAHLHSNDPPVAYPDGRARPLVEVYLERWLIGAVAKVYESAQNVMLVLSGPQNAGKSELSRWLCPPHLRAAHHAEGRINPEDKDHRLRLMSVWIWEVSELDNTTRKTDFSALKEFITHQQVKERRAYGRHDTVKPAMTSFIGTVNNDSGFLVDPTGNRRFMVLSITGIDWAYQQIPIDQLWAEAVARYRRGEPWRLSPDELAHQSAQNRLYQSDSVLVDHLRRHLFITGDPSHLMTAGDVVDHLAGKGVRLSGSDRAQAMEISAAMGLLGVKKDRVNNVRYYVGITPKP